ncbi:MAG: hypothetical protein Q7T54_00815 [Candidatus Levybacteria bacterium]|nr:hypothetical protein [Candidatus Levybacteria bacterium]
MAKKKKKSDAMHFFQNTRTGFYSLVIVTIILMLSAINMYGSANFESDVLGDSDRSKDRAEKNEEEKEKEEQKREEKEKKSEEMREENKQKIEQKYEINPEKIKLEYQYEDANSKIKRKIEFKDGEQQIEEEIENKLVDDIEEDFEDESETEIASDSSSVTITKNKVKARSGFPLTIDGATNQLIVTRPDGSTKAVSILPDQAVENFMRHKKINLINFEEPDTGTPSGDTGNTGSESAENTGDEDQAEIKLVEYDSQVAYEIKGKKKLKLLGFFPITTPTTGYVSAETGDVIGQDESLFTKFLDLLSP